MENFIYDDGKHTLNYAKRIVMVDGKEVSLTPRYQRIVSYVKKILRQHNANIEVTSVEGQVTALGFILTEKIICNMISIDQFYIANLAK